MKVALIPDRDNFFANQIFNAMEVSKHRDNILLPWVQVKQLFSEQGIEFNTIDCYENLNEVDWFIFNIHNPEWLLRLHKEGLSGRTIYVAYEPEVVNRRHSRKGIYDMLKLYSRVATWNRELIDMEYVHELHGPYFIKRLYDDCQDVRPNVLTFIYSNKVSEVENELYSLRRKVVDYFETNRNYPFRFYGVGWNKEEFSNYKGELENKQEAYLQTKFAICFENIQGTKGGVTEKVFDCLNSGTIPIYYGDNAIDEYVPENCYIDYKKFGSIDSMVEYIYNMPEEKYINYRRNIDVFYNNIQNAECFTPAGYSKLLKDIFAQSERRVSLGIRDRILLGIHGICRKLKRRVRRRLE